MKIKNKRILALTIDLIIIGFFVRLLSSLVDLNFSQGNLFLFDTNFTYGYSLVFIIYIIYFFVFDYINNGVTFGKRIFKIEVIQIDKTRLSLSKRLIRSILKVVSIIIFPITLLMFMINGKTLHDNICKTKSINNLNYVSIKSL